MSEIFQAYQNYIWFTFLIVAMVLLTMLQRFRDAAFALWQVVLEAVKFLGDALTESTGKTSYSRVAGSYVIFKITTTTGDIPEQWMTLFMFLIGYQLISGLLKDNPAITEIIRAKYGLPPQKAEEAAQ